MDDESDGADEHSEDAGFDEDAGVLGVEDGVPGDSAAEPGPYAEVESYFFPDVDAFVGGFIDFDVGGESCDFEGNAAGLKCVADAVYDVGWHDGWGGDNDQSDSGNEEGSTCENTHGDECDEEGHVGGSGEGHDEGDKACNDDECEENFPVFGGCVAEESAGDAHYNQEVSAEGVGFGAAAFEWGADAVECADADDGVDAHDDGDGEEEDELSLECFCVVDDEADHEEDEVEFEHFEDDEECDERLQRKRAQAKVLHLVYELKEKIEKTL